MNKRQKKLKQFKKKHIIAPIAGLLLYTFLVIILLVFFLEVGVAFAVDGYVKRSQDVVRVLGAEYLEMTEKGVSKIQAVENMKSIYGEIIECFAILDEDYRVIAATGGLTYDTSTSISINLDTIRLIESIK